MKFAIGQSMPRVEDADLLRGRGRYSDDVAIDDCAHAFVLRSPHAHARIRSISSDAARAMPGVLAVLSGADVLADGLGPIPCLIPLKSSDGSDRSDTPRPILAIDKVRHVGDPVALIVARTLAQAKDAAEAVECDYEALPATVDAFAAAQPDAPQVWDHAQGNQCFDWANGDAAGVDAAMAKAAHITRATILNNRIVVASMEPRSAIAGFDLSNDRSTLYTPSQGAHILLDQLAGVVLKIPKEKLRIVTGQVGGSFGMKLFLYPEQALVLWASRRLRSAVRWTGERTESFLSDIHGRDNRSYAELALDAQGHMLGLRVTTHANLGAYLSNYGPFIPTYGTVMLAGQYQTPAIHVRVKGMFTHTVPVDAYRGAGRPEAIYLIERLIDIAAREVGLTPDEMRRRNFIPASAMPFKTALGDVYDSGDFAGLMQQCMDSADWSTIARRRQLAAARGKLLGVGMACYIERCGGGSPETSVVRINPQGTVTIISGSQDNGQGQLSTQVQIVAHRLGIDPACINVIQGDTDIVPMGFTGGSRFAPVAGVATSMAANSVIDQGKEVAADKLEVATADIEYHEGRYRVAGTDLSMGLFDVAKVKPLLATQTRTPDALTFPNGCHIAEIEIDRATGVVEVVRYTVVDDFGYVINPTIVAGQVHGGIVQGIGQALYEQTSYDAESGQLLSASFMDYALPRADQVATIDFELRNVPCTTNPMGIKGAGEAGAVGAPAAMINAIVDALQGAIKHIDMPATQERIWAAMAQGQR